MSQHPFSRPPDRPLIHNPNHQPAPQPQHPPFYPSASQPPLQVPFNEPYQRRDPFLPRAQQHERREGYGYPGRDTLSALNNGERPPPGGWGALQHNQPPHAHAHAHGQLHHQTVPPPPPPMTAPHNGPAPGSYSYDASRRRSLGGSSPPRYYNGAPLDPPPPPPSFGGRHMPPPSSPQQPHPAAPSYSSSQRPPPPPFSNGRDLPGLGPSHRSSSSGMSISSILGTDSRAPPRSPPSHASRPSSTSASVMQPPSPRAQPSEYRPDASRWSRPRTPEKYGMGQPRYQEVTSHPRGSHGSPEQARPGEHPQVSQHHSHQYPSSSYSSPHDIREPERARQGPNNMPPRPNSQPAGTAAPPEDPAQQSRYEPGYRRPIFGYSTAEQRKAADEQARHERAMHERRSIEMAERERAATVQPLSQSSFSPPQGQRHIPPGPYDNRDYRSEDPYSRRDDYPTLFRREGPPNDVPQATARMPEQPPRNPPPSNESPQFRPHPPPPDFRQPMQRSTDPFHNPPPAEQSVMERRPQDPFDPQARAFGYDPRRFEDMQRRFPGLSPEAGRRPGHASPLPQAVQGAQAQFMSHGNDPSIKSEFGRMFSGLGSGLGSVPPNGTLTPSRQSPLPQGRPGDDVEGMTPADTNGLKMTRGGSRGGRKGRRIKDEDGRHDSESGDGRGTPASTRGAKRAKHSHTPFHHHHHAHTLHHHHRHHKPDDDPNASAPAASAAAPVLVPPPPPKKPTLTINSQKLLDSVAHLPRSHLGSKLYTSHVEVPHSQSARLLEEDSLFKYKSSHEPIPHFPDNMNCTFTVRVPRYYLKPEQRVDICETRALWGTDVYTDDSDPIAAAMHAGWILGAWTDDVDRALLDLGPAYTRGTKESILDDGPESGTGKQIPIPKLMTEPLAAGPVEPPENMEAHITLLILPRLEEYKGVLRRGVKSRTWGGNHDGVSFRVVRVEWVDEGCERGAERGAEARRRRLREGLGLFRN
ncbi:Rxt3-domain-containing protein [Aulographum hederae CBS 113979]|uniref:Rxt3-domain-containing protein n=1 Tax=Aulographum hederae CBS 113979 TaxID=1176131 RepID=A0A6G1HEA8_9PEZI|nr:Rxt3-domain-containing protein [Aulographum hederae CBS 113979]